MDTIECVGERAGEPSRDCMPTLFSRHSDTIGGIALRAPRKVPRLRSDPLRTPD
jgi:hypothetical protein